MMRWRRLHLFSYLCFSLARLFISPERNDNPYESCYTRFSGLRSDKVQMKSGQASGKLERKIVEKNRRMHMKRLNSKLASVIPCLQNEKAKSQQDRLDQATIHIKNLQERIQNLVLKSERRVEGTRGNYITELSPPVVEVRNLASGIEVVLATGVDRTFKLSDAITILNEEGVNVKYAGFTVAGCRVFCTIHSQLAIPRLGCDCGRMRERLKLLVQ